MRWLIIVSFTLVSCWVAHPSLAQIPCNDCAGAEPFLDGLISAGGVYDIAEEELKSKPESEWTEDEVTQFLALALSIAYMNYNVDIRCNDHSVSDYLSDYSDLPHVTVWPNNPYNEWKPMNISEAPGAFSPGDIVVEVCPDAGSAQGSVVSFQMYIFGPTLDSPVSHLQVLESNRDWAFPPAGAVLTMGLHVETDEEHEQRVEVLKKMMESSSEDDEAIE